MAYVLNHYFKKEVQKGTKILESDSIIYDSQRLNIVPLNK